MLDLLAKPLALVLVLALTVSGCASTTGPAPLDGDGHGAGAALAHGDGCSHASDSGLRPTGHSGARAALYGVAGLLFLFAVTVDVLALPFTHHDPFPCCRAVVSLCH